MVLDGLVSGQADDIVARMRAGAPYKFLGKNPDGATKFAADGYFVIGGIESSEMANDPDSGHVFVVVPGGPSSAGITTPWKDSKDKAILSRGGAPYCYNGSSNPKIPTDVRTQVDIIFSRADERSVVYGAVADPRRAGSDKVTASSGSVLSHVLALLNGLI